MRRYDAIHIMIEVTMHTNIIVRAIPNVNHPANSWSRITKKPVTAITKPKKNSATKLRGAVLYHFACPSDLVAETSLLTTIPHFGQNIASDGISFPQLLQIAKKSPEKIHDYTV